jgi:fumarate reductase subunit D
MRHRTIEPFFWSLFSSGGMLAALVLPAVAIVLWIAIPSDWISPPDYGELARAVGHPLMRLGLFALISLSAFHWGHRFRFTLYDGLQLKHLFGLIATICYGGATAITFAAAYVLLTFSP